LYRQIKIKDQGLKSSIEYRNSGSKLSRLLPLTLNMATRAGLPKVKVGTNENPLLVALTEPLKWTTCFALSVFCAKANCATHNSVKKSQVFGMILLALKERICFPISLLF
jgi:hypothetical protein